MKSLFLLLFLCSNIFLFAQDIDSSPQKPFLILRGSAHADNSISKQQPSVRPSSNFPFSSYNHYLNTEFSLGKTISNKMELGLQFSFSFFTSGNNFDFKTYFDKIYQRSLSLGIYNRYALNSNQKIRFYLRSSFTWNQNKNNFFLNKGNPESSFTITLLPEVSYALSPRINLVASLGNMNYHFQRTKKENESKITDNFNARFNLSSLTIGGELLFFHDKPEFPLATSNSNKKFILGLDTYFKIYKTKKFNNFINTQISFDQYFFLRAKGGSTFSINPYIGYIISKRWVAGVIFDYTKFNFDVADFSKTYRTNQNKIGLGFFARYTIHPNRKLKFLLDANTIFNSLSIKRKFDNANRFSDNTRYNYLNFIVTPKLSYNIKNQFNITMSIGNLSYLTSLNSDNQINKFPEISEAYHFNFNYGISYMKFGLEYAFGENQ